MADFSNVSIRKKSLEGVEWADELAELGACRNKWENNLIACYQCGLEFHVEKVTEIMNNNKLDFIGAGSLVHATNYPSCELLRTLPKLTLETILGNIKRTKRLRVKMLNITFDYVIFSSILCSLITFTFRAQLLWRYTVALCCPGR